MINLPPRYQKVIKHFTAGGMADTLLCYDSHLQREVVVKGIKSLTDSAKLVDELSALSAIRSKYVVEVLDVIVEGGAPVGFVEEYLPGAALSPLAPPATELDMLRALYPIAAGVSAVHGHGRIHRDLKPDNMRYDAEGQLKIFDFGLAKEAQNPGTGVLYYTDGFTAPESFSKGTSGMHTFDFPVDVFAFACIGMWLFNSGEIISELKGVKPFLPAGFSFSSLPCAVDGATGALLQACLHTDPGQRPTIFQMCEHLSRELLRDRHTMVLTYKGNQHVVGAMKKSVTLTVGLNSISVAYSGVDFNVSAVVGPILINNIPAVIGQKVTGSTVFVFNMGGGRKESVTCDVSHPEVML